MRTSRLSASRLLGDKGRFYFINRAERMVEMIGHAAAAFGLQPKEVRVLSTQTVHERAKYLLMAASKKRRRRA